LEYLRSNNNYILDFSRKEIKKKINEKNEMAFNDYKTIYLGEE